MRSLNQNVPQNGLINKCSSGSRIPFFSGLSAAIIHGCKQNFVSFTAFTDGYEPKKICPQPSMMAVNQIFSVRSHQWWLRTEYFPSAAINDGCEPYIFRPQPSMMAANRIFSVRSHQWWLRTVYFSSAAINDGCGPNIFRPQPSMMAANGNRKLSTIT